MMQDTNALVDRFRQTFNQKKNEFDTQMRIQKENADANKEMAIYEKNMERQMKGLHPMMKEDTVKGMAPGQVGGMIGGSSKEMGGEVKMIGQGLAPNNMEQPMQKIDTPTIMMASKNVMNGPTPMMKEDAVKAMAPGQMGGMIGGSSKEMGGEVEMIGQGLAQKMEMDVATAKEVPMIRKEVENMPEAIAGKINPEVKKIVESFGKPERSEVEQKKMEVMEKLGVEPPKDANDMEDLRKGIYRPGGKEIPGTGVIESLIKDLQAFGSVLGKLTAGQQSGYTSGEMFGSSNFMILIALVTAIILASRR
jgi:hypothetical protein